MNAIHTNWTLPRGEAEDFELLTTIISALKWRELNGGIAMITDKNGAELYRKNRLDFLWNNGIYEYLSDITADPEMFWAIGKIYALRHQKAPIAVLDTDFIVWKKLNFSSIKDAAVIHFEDINEELYPPVSAFKMKNDFDFLRTDEALKACNTAFYVIKNQRFLDFYTREAIRFAENCENVGEPLTYMLYAEQRLFNVCAAKLGIETEAFADIGGLYTDNSVFTHIWGMKQQMRENKRLREKFCLNCAERIKTDFPDCVPVLKKASYIGKYFTAQ